MSTLHQAEVLKNSYARYCGFIRCMLLLGQSLVALMWVYSPLFLKKHSVVGELTLMCCGVKVI